jgi:subtilisin family serine protease
MSPVLLLLLLFGLACAQPFVTTTVMRAMQNAQSDEAYVGTISELIGATERWVIRYDFSLADFRLLDIIAAADDASALTEIADCFTLSVSRLPDRTYFEYVCDRPDTLAEAIVDNWATLEATDDESAVLPFLVAETLQLYHANPRVLVVYPSPPPAPRVSNVVIADAGLDRLDSRARSFDGLYTSTLQGTGVIIYVIDTGIRADHVEFTGRAEFIGNTVDGTDSDCHGHGTHVASLAAGRTYGTAHNATVRAVKVLDCDGTGTTLSVALGVDIVRSECEGSPDQEVVVNLSLGGPSSSLIDDAIAALLAACRVVVVVAAGNDGSQCCNTSPGATTGVISVAASETTTDGLAWFSNYGSCVRIAAPGTGILGAAISSTTAAGRIDGTSASSPFVAGIAALAFEKRRSLDQTGAQIREYVVAAATAGIVARPAYAALPMAFNLGPGGATTGTASGSASIVPAYAILVTVLFLIDY